MSKRDFFNYLKQSQGFKSKELEAAFEQIDRKDFVLDSYRDAAYGDYPLPIGYGGTISQPSTVLFMLNLIDPKPGEKILDIGSGSGWTTALLAEVTGNKGQVIGTEIVPELVEFGQNNLAKYNLKHSKILLVEELGLKQQQPFDKILVSAAARELPGELVDQLKIGGRLVMPIRSSVWKIGKLSKDKVSEEEYPGFAFVPLQ